MSTKTHVTSKLAIFLLLLSANSFFIIIIYSVEMHWEYMQSHLSKTIPFVELMFLILINAISLWMLNFSHIQNKWIYKSYEYITQFSYVTICVSNQEDWRVVYILWQITFGVICLCVCVLDAFVYKCSLGNITHNAIACLAIHCVYVIWRPAFTTLYFAD